MITRTSPVWPYIVGLVAYTAGCATDDAPTTPTDVRIVSPSTTSLEITWSAPPAGDRVDRYDVYRDGALAGTVDVPSALDSGLRAGSRHCYTVVAVALGNIRSPQSEEVCGFTQWNREMVDWSGYGNGQDYWSDVSLALDGANRPHLGYTATRLAQTSARYMSRAQGTWSAPTLAGGATGFSSTTVAVASDNGATLCYVRSDWMAPTELVCQRFGVAPPTIVVRAQYPGADAATIPADVFKALVKHPLTDKGLDAFLADWGKTGQSIL